MAAQAVGTVETEEALSSVLKILAAVVVGLPLVMYLLQERLIFYPRPLSDAYREAIAQRYPNAESFFVEASDGTRLHAWHVKAAPGAPLVLYFGGNAEEVSWMLDEVSRRAPAVGWLLTDYRGYGASGGSPSEAALVSDALAWYDFSDKKLQTKSVYVFGRSLGSGVAVQLAAARPVAGVILVAPFDSLVEVAKRHYPYLPVSWMLKHRFDSLSRAPRLDVPLLCLAATRDHVIPAEHAKRLYDAWGGPKRWVALEGADHNSTDEHPDYWPSIMAFLHD